MSENIRIHIGNLRRALVDNQSFKLAEKADRVLVDRFRPQRQVFMYIKNYSSRIGRN